MKALIFDLDGTLLDTLADIAACVNAVRAELGLRPHPRAAYRRFVGDGLRRLLARALPPGALRDGGLERASRRFSQLYDAGALERTRPYPGIARMLDGAVRRGLPMAVVTNKPQRFARKCVSALLPRWRFAAVLGARPGVPLKPHPAAALAAARALRAEPADIAYLGDTGVDMKTARAAGMVPFAALWGFRGARELRRAGARRLLRRPTELLRALDGAV